MLFQFTGFVTSSAFETPSYLYFIFMNLIPVQKSIVINVIKVDNREHHSSEYSPKKRENLSDILFFSSTFACCDKVD